MSNIRMLHGYSKWFNSTIEMLPAVHHYSWFDIERKIHTYKNYWQRHWESLYDIKQEDTAENNMFFDKPWSDITDTEISKKAKELANHTGGHVFHTKFNMNSPTPHVTIERGHPKEYLDHHENSDK